MTDRVGQRFGDYRLKKRLGKGGFAEVYLGEHIYLHTEEHPYRVAIKVLHPKENEFTPEDIQLFRQEAQLIRLLDHPHIIRLLGFSVAAIQAQRIPYLVMPYVSSGSLEGRHPHGVQLPLAAITSYLTQIAAALQYAHEHKIVHRDIKPENFLLKDEATILLSDFGIGVLAHRTDSLVEQKIQGTATYMAPEQFKGKAIPASDQYSLGIVVYEWLCGVPPFTGNFLELTYQHSFERTPPFPENIALPSAVENVVLRALAKDPQERFACVKDFATALEKAARPALPRKERVIDLQSAEQEASKAGAPSSNNVQPQDEPGGSGGAAIGARGAAGLAAGLGLDALAAHNGSSAPPHPEHETAHFPAARAPAPQGPPAVSPARSPTGRRTTGKNAARAAGAFGAGSGAGATLATQAPGTGGTPPPTRGNAGGPGGGGGDSPRRTRRTVLVWLIFLTFLLVAAIAFAAPGGLGRLSNVFPGSSPPAKVTITPVRKDVKDAFVITAVTRTPDAAKREVQARQLTATTPGQSKTVGTGPSPATVATGTLTFSNALTFSQTISVGTVLRGADGVQVETTHLALIPAANPPTEGAITVAARAVQAGASGNIKAFDINGTCCVSGVTVQNRAGFSGGQNATTYAAVQQSDIDGAATPLKTLQTQSAQRGLSAEMKSNEKLVTPPQCSTHVTSNPKAGEQATSVTVSVTATCRGEVYDEQGAKTLAVDVLKTEAQKRLGSHYALQDDDSLTQISSASSNASQGTISLHVHAEGIWVYQFSDAQKQNLAKLIAGKSIPDAKHILVLQTGVSDAQITTSNGSTTLPTTPSDMTIVIGTGSARIRVQRGMSAHSSLYAPRYFL